MIFPKEDNSNDVNLQLHKREKNQYWSHPSIATVTFCTGDPQKCLSNLKTKLLTVLNANPWLAGRLVLIKKVKTCLHPITGSSSLVDAILSLQIKGGINRGTKYADLVKITGGNPALTVQRTNVAV